jgi:hypothetical protein
VVWVGRGCSGGSFSGVVLWSTQVTQQNTPEMCVHNTGSQERLSAQEHNERCDCWCASRCGPVNMSGWVNTRACWRDEFLKTSAQRVPTCVCVCVCVCVCTRVCVCVCVCVLRTVILFGSLKISNTRFEDWLQNDDAICVQSTCSRV